MLYLFKQWLVYLFKHVELHCFKIKRLKKVNKSTLPAVLQHNLSVISWMEARCLCSATCCSCALVGDLFISYVLFDSCILHSYKDHLQSTCFLTCLLFGTCKAQGICLRDLFFHGEPDSKINK